MPLEASGHPGARVSGLAVAILEGCFYPPVLTKKANVRGKEGHE
jgi:hypothetical protein